LEELDTIMAFEQLTEMASERYWSENADKLVMAMLTFPQLADDALSRVTAPATQRATVPPSDASPSASAATLCLLLLAAVAFLSRSRGNGWTEQASIFALMLAGLLALRGTGKS
jgi:hypothetical protein